MTYNEFVQSKLSKQSYTWWRLSVVNRLDQMMGVIMQWEPSNARWYWPDYLEGRIESGSYSKIWIPFTQTHEAWDIMNIQAFE